MFTTHTRSIIDFDSQRFRIIYLSIRPKHKIVLQLFQIRRRIYHCYQTLLPWNYIEIVVTVSHVEFPVGYVQIFDEVVRGKYNLVRTVQIVHSQLCRIQLQIFESLEKGSQNRPIILTNTIYNLSINKSLPFLTSKNPPLKMQYIPPLVRIQRKRSRIVKQLLSTERHDLNIVVSLDRHQLVINNDKSVTMRMVK